MRFKIKLHEISVGLIMLCAFGGCNLINPEEPIPALINMNSIDLQTSTGQGSDRHKITEVWLYDEFNFIGTFRPPVNIPIITDAAETNFTFRPGIRNNGILDDGIIYPMYTSFEATLNTTPGAVTEVNPIFMYKPEAVFSLVADFEVTNEFVDNRDTISASELTRSSVEPFEGQHSGEIILSQEAHYIEVANAIAMVDLPTDGTPVYLEFQYKSEAAIEIGILGIPLTGQNFRNYFYLLKPSETWNMIYIELTEWLKVSDLPAYKILFSARYPQNSTTEEYKIQLDNIKVVHL